MGRAGADLRHGARHRGRRARPGFLDARLLRRIVGCLARLHRLVAPGRRGDVDAGESRVQRLERRTGIRHHAGIERKVVGEPRSASLDLQQPGARGKGRARRVPDFLEERTAHHQHEIVAGQLPGDARRIEGQCAAIGGMVGRERILATQSLEPHRGAEFLDELDQHLVGAGPGDVVARDDGWVPGRRQQLRHGGDARRIGAGRGVGMAGLAGRNGSLLLHHVDRQCHEHRTGRRLVGDLEGTLEDRAQLVRALDLHAPLGHGRGDRREVVAEHGIAQAHARVLLARRHDHR